LNRISLFTLNSHADNKRLLLTILLVLTLCLIPGCSNQKRVAEGDHVFVDEQGRSVKINPEPHRIISLAPSVTETLFALGLGDRIVGVTSYCDYPPEAAQKERVGDTLRPGMEKIVALKPDLVIASTASQLEQFVRRLDELGVPIYVTNPRGIDDVLASIERIGEITGAEERAVELTRALRARIDATEQRVAPLEKQRVLFILGTEPLITAGATSFVTDLITRAGGKSISDDAPGDYPQYSLETAVAKQPEVIFLQAGESELPSRLKQTPAARSGRVYRLNDDLLLRPGPRIVEGLEQMAEKIQGSGIRGQGPGRSAEEQRSRGAREQRRILLCSPAPPCAKHIIGHMLLCSTTSGPWPLTPDPRPLLYL
jgi:iron complex transport system substrate-binding protein